MMYLFEFIILIIVIISILLYSNNKNKIKKEKEYIDSCKRSIWKIKSEKELDKYFVFCVENITSFKKESKIYFYKNLISSFQKQLLRIRKEEKEI